MTPLAAILAVGLLLMVHATTTTAAAAVWPALSNSGGGIFSGSTATNVAAASVMCPDTDDSSPQVSWCAAQNPFLTFLPWPSSAFTQHSDDDIVCAGTGLHDLCQLVTSTTTFDTAQWTVELHGTTKGQLVMSATQSNTVGVITNTYHPGRTNSSISRLTSTVHNGTAFVSATYGSVIDKIQLYRWHDDTAELVQCAAPLLVPESGPVPLMSQYESIVSVQFFEMNGTLYHLTALSAAGGQRTGLVWIHRMNRDCSKVDMMYWTLNLQDVIELQSVQLVMQHFAQNTSVLVWDQMPPVNGTSRALLVVTTTTTVEIFQFIPKANVQLLIGSQTSRSVFFSSPSAGISNAMVVGDMLRRVDFNGTRTAQEQKLCTQSLAAPQLLWLVVAHSPSSGRNVLETLALSDLQFMPHELDITNPAHRSMDWTGCPTNTAWMDQATGTCWMRQSKMLALRNQVTALSYARRGMPPSFPFPGLANIVVSSVMNGFLNTSLDAICEAQFALDHNIAQLQSCLTEVTAAVNDLSVCDYYGALYNSTDVGLLLQNFLYTVVMVQMPDPVAPGGLSEAARTDVMAVGLQQVLKSPVNSVPYNPSAKFTDAPSLPHLRVQSLSNLTLLGDVIDLHLTQNSLHLFAATQVQRWQIASNQRLRQICQHLAQHPSDEFLSAYSAGCTQLKQSGFQLSQYFGWFVSSCPPGVYCPSFTSMAIPLEELIGSSTGSVPDGAYTQWSYRLELCTEGSFCTAGRKIACLPGTQCPHTNMGHPLPCLAANAFNVTCFNAATADGTGTVTASTCPLGTVCTVPYLPGFPAPPGTYVPSGARLDLDQCADGDWCSLGQHNTTQLPCPADTYCNATTVLEPTVCPFNASYASFCPSGTQEAMPCPAGFYCSMPNNKTRCDLHSYCPPGSLVETTCEPGYYCPTPSQKYLCPSGTYCHAGSLTPTTCNIFTSCPPGSTSEARSADGAVVIVLVVLGFAGLWRLYVWRRDARRAQLKKQQERHRKRREAAARKLSRTDDVIGAMDQPLLNDSGDHVLSDDEVEVETGEQGVLSTFGGLGRKDFMMDFSFNNLGLTLHGSNTVVLAGVTGSINHGKLTAVMGPSGSGKTTFLTTLAGRASYGRTTGMIRINGQPDNVSRYKKLVGFVPQEDVMLREMTVYENLAHAAITRLPRDMSYQAKMNVVTAVIDVLGLADCAHSTIGDEDTRGISGGQRKRVNIGIELAAYPTALFLDEPTSGLDATASQEVISALKTVAQSLGLTIVSVIHQPRYEIFELFDEVLLLGKGGRTVYIGPSSESLNYFEKVLGRTCPPRVNPADFFLDVIAEDVNRELPDRWQRYQQEMAAGLAAGLENSPLPVPVLQALPPFGPSHSSEGKAMADLSEAGVRSPLLRNESLTSEEQSTLSSAVLQVTRAREWHQNDVFLSSRQWGLFFTCCLSSFFTLFFGMIASDVGASMNAIRYPADATVGDKLKRVIWSDPVFRSTELLMRYGGVVGLSSALVVGSSLAVAILTVMLLVDHLKLGQLFFLSGWAVLMILFCTASVLMVRWFNRRRERTAAYREELRALCDVLVHYSRAGPQNEIDDTEAYHLSRVEALVHNLVREEEDEHASLINIASFLISMMLLGPFGMVYVFLKYRERKIARLSALLGFAAQCFIIGVMMSIVYGVAWATYGASKYGETAVLAGAALVYISVVSGIVVHHRISRVPSSDRATASSLYQFWVFCKRSLVQQTRNIPGVVFDLGICWLAGLFLGLIYMNSSYKGPLPQAVVNQCPGAIREICELPLFDPIVGQGSLTCLALSLASMASSLRVFGSEKVVFRRESSTGTSTEAYYLGKSIAHLPTIFLAPLLFLVMYYQLASPLASFWWYYLLFVLVYFTASGFSYLISIICGASIAQLVGVLMVLSCMMFSGANPTLPQLKDPSLLGGLLYIPTYISYIRWTQELYYLLEIQKYTNIYNIYPGIHIFGYATSDLLVCWLVTLVTAIAVRGIALVALIKREP